MPIISQKNHLTDQERAKIKVLIKEAENRGLPIADIVRKKFAERTRQWMVDSNGYFPRYDGKRFKPYLSQKEFVHSLSRFTLFVGGRGCVAPNTIVKGIPIAERKTIGLVDTLYGKKFASKAYLKGVAPLYSVKTKAGAEVQVTEQHRFLTPLGWLPLSQLGVGDLILSDGTWHAEMGREIKLNSLFPHSTNNYSPFFDEIQDIKFSKIGEFYDISVPNVEHYSAQGIYHHNSGKSCGGAQKALQKIKQGYSGAVFNPKFEHFKDSTWPEFRNWIPWEYVIRDHRYRSDISWEPQRPFKIAFENGATVICKGLNDPSSARGPNINWLWFDEAQDDSDGMAWKIAIASVRVGANPQAWATATGRGTYHWMYSFFVEQEFPPDVLEELQKIQKEMGSDVPLIEAFEGTIFDNKDNLDPMFFASMLASYPEGYLRDQELYGKFRDPGVNLGNPAWFSGKVLPDEPKTVENRVRYWDLAASEKKVSGKNKMTDPDETVGTKLSWFKEDEIDNFCIEEQVSGTWEWSEIKERIINTARTDGPFVPIYIEEEPGSGGINQVKQIRIDVEKELPGWTVREHNPKKEGGDKVVRANIWFAEASRGKFYMVQGSWNQQFLKQLSSFPNAKHDDKIDSVSGARICCAPIFKWRKTEFIHLGQNFDDKKEEQNTV